MIQSEVVEKNKKKTHFMFNFPPPPKIVPKMR